MASRHLQRRVERTKGTAVRCDHQTCFDRPIARNRRWSGRNGLACGDARIKWLYRCCCKSPRQHRGRTFIWRATIELVDPHGKRVTEADPEDGGKSRATALDLARTPHGYHRHPANQGRDGEGTGEDGSKNRTT